MLVGEAIDLNQFFTVDQQREVTGTFNRIGFGNLTGVFEALGGRYDYGRLRILRAAMSPPR